ncbi:MAG: flagellar FliJ family protein [Emcibacter sp.]|nr:flagellar FliJ family protein [Emcibacter sp.]MBL4893584.1 flagellar FliJ family protein [Emcibacter sp.]
MSRKGMTGMIRLHKWQLDEKRRNMSDLEKMRADLQQNLTDLQVELIAEQKKVAESPVVSIAYAGYAQQVGVRRINIVNSILEVEVSIEDMKDQLADAFKELKKYEIVEQRERQRKLIKRNRVQQAELDEMASNIHRRRQTMG